MTPERAGEVEVFLTGMLWSTIGMFIRLMNEAGATPEWIGLVRYTLAFAIMAAMVAARGGLAAFRVGGRALGIYAVLGVLCQGVCCICYVLAIDLTGMAVSAVLMSSAPAFTALFSFLFFKEHMSPRKAAALGLNILGCALAGTGGHLDLARFSLAGLVYGLASGLLYGLTAIVGRFASGRRSDVFVVSAYSYLFAAAFLAPCVWLRGGGCLVTFQGLGYGFLLALIPTSLAYALYYDGLRKIRELSRVPIIASMECVMAIALGVAVFGEAMGAWNYLGAALVCLSVVLIGKIRA